MTLPAGWRSAHISEVADLKLGKMLDQVKNKGELRPYLRNVNVRWGNFDLSDLAQMRVTSEEAEQLAVCDGDLFICEGGEPGRAAVWRGGTSDLVFQKALHRVRPHALIDPEFIAAYLGFSARQGLLADFLTGTTIKHLPQDALSRISLPLAPANEQRRIVAKLEALSTRSARARAESARASLLAGKIRKKSLQLAYSGELTADWRGGLIKSERKGALPATWRQVSLGDIADIKSGITLGKKREPDEKLVRLPYLRVANVQRGGLNLEVVKQVSVTIREADMLYLRAGDILMNEGGDRDKLGRGCVWNEEIKNCIHQNHVFRVRLKDVNVIPQYISFYTNEFGSEYFFEHGTQTTNLASLSKARLSALPLPLAPVDEQAEILRRLEAVFARVDRLEAEAARATKLLDRLEDSILAKAFQGELVPQDPADEPASVLLDCIRTERAAAPQAKRGRRVVSAASS